MFSKLYINNIKNEIEENKILHTWSEKVPFVFLEESTEEEKKAIIAEVIEEYASELISNHNYIAKQYGLTYSFYVPQFLQNTSEQWNFPMIVAVFQGWPLTASKEIVYENCIDAAVYIQEVKKSKIITWLHFMCLFVVLAQ